MINLEETICSQYANSPTLMQLVLNMNQYIDPRANMKAFYDFLWNVDTAAGKFLDIWGRIVGVSRVVPIPGTSGVFGFETSDTPPDWENFGHFDGDGAGGPFYAGQVTTGGYTLTDNSFRTLILTKALANIASTTAPALNQLVRNLFPGRGRCYTRDLGNMRMSYVFEFELTNIELAILQFSGVLPHPAGVLVNVLVVPAGLFGFAEAGDLAHGFVETGDAGAFYPLVA